MFNFLRGRSASSTTTKTKAPETKESFEFGRHRVIVQRQAYKRSLGLTLKVDGTIKVVAPKMTPIERIRSFVEMNGEWIEGNLAKYSQLRAKHPPKRYRDGEVFPFIGRSLTLAYVCSQAGEKKPKFWVEGERLLAEIPREQWLAFDPEADHPEIALALTAFFSESGKIFLGSRIATLSERMQLFPSSVVFRSQRTRWGSCSSHGRVSLNWRLIFAPVEVIDYVIVHELAHLQHYDHSPAFWRLVATQVPEYARLRNWLREHQYDADFLAKRSELHA